MKKSSCLLFLVFLGFLSCSPPAADTHTTPKWWVWMGNHADWSEVQWQEAFQTLQETGIGGILLGADTAVLRRASEQAEMYDIEIHAWFWTMNRGEAKAEWLSVNRQGKSLAEQMAYVGYYKFMCPALPEVKEYLLKKMDELSMVKGLSGIHFDYIRYVDVILPIGLQPKYNLVQDHEMPEFDYGYHPYMRQLYLDSMDIDPLKMEQADQNAHWHRFRLDRLNETVIQLRDRVRENELSVSSAVFPTPALSRKMVRQDWESWDLDYYFPMVYHNFYNESFPWITAVMEENIQTVGPETKVFCGLYLPALKKPDDLQKAIQAALDGGANGVSFFNYGNLTPELREVIKSFSKPE